MESIPTSSLTVCYVSCTASDQRSLQRMVRTAERVIRTSPPPVQDLCPSRCCSRATKMVSDPTHPAHGLFRLRPSSKRYRDGAVLPMASVVLRWVMILWILAQVVIFCGALDPVHIQLDLDGKKTDNKNDQTKYDMVKEISGLVKIWFNAQDPDKPTYNNPAQRDLVEKAGLKKLYVRGTFQIKEYGGGDRAFLWDNEKRDAKKLGEFILKIFKDGAIVIVVFPGDLQTYTGFQFQKEFEEVVQKPNGKITVGRGVINVYLGLGDQNLVDGEIKRQKQEEERDFKKNEKYYSIFANYHPNAFSFSTAFTAWRTERNPANIFQVKIQEADLVVVRLMAVCSSDQNGLKVGSHAELGLADIVFKLLRVQDVETHPKQKIRVELPKTCGKPQEREAYTGRLVDRLKEKKLNVYGKEPSIHIQLYRNQRADDAFHKDVAIIKKSHPQDIVGEIKDDKVVSQVTDQERKDISSAKELFLHIHCHGIFYGNSGTICGKDPKALSDILFKFIESLLDKSVPGNGFIKFHVCEAGSEKVQTLLARYQLIINIQRLYIQPEEAAWSYFGLVKVAAAYWLAFFA
ncbi:hypothetical protein NFI96_002274 [Prochilodus magdalenae]|nr:hypothetical protein NFI96_002274 [Prochilodus magdalenae]